MPDPTTATQDSQASKSLPPDIEAAISKVALPLLGDLSQRITNLESSMRAMDSAFSRRVDALDASAGSALPKLINSLADRCDALEAATKRGTAESEVIQAAYDTTRRVSAAVVALVAIVERQWPHEAKGLAAALKQVA